MIACDNSDGVAFAESAASLIDVLALAFETFVCAQAVVMVGRRELCRHIVILCTSA